MTTLAETISGALMAVGPETEDRLRDIVAELGALNLTEEDRLSALATAIAAAAWIHHGRHKAVYLDAVRTWSLEISVDLEPPPVRLVNFCTDTPIEEAAELLIAGLEDLIDTMTSACVGVQDRLITELPLFAQLLGQYDANSIHQTFNAIATACAAS